LIGRIFDAQFRGSKRLVNINGVARFACAFTLMGRVGNLTSQLKNIDQLDAESSS
jgi:hypothetical protein